MVCDDMANLLCKAGFIVTDSNSYHTHNSLIFNSPFYDFSADVPDRTGAGVGIIVIQETVQFFYIGFQGAGNDHAAYLSQACVVCSKGNPAVPFM